MGLAEPGPQPQLEWSRFLKPVPNAKFSTKLRTLSSTIPRNGPVHQLRSRRVDKGASIGELSGNEGGSS